MFGFQMSYCHTMVGDYVDVKGCNTNTFIYSSKNYLSKYTGGQQIECKLVTLWSRIRFEFGSATTDSFVSSVICKHQCCCCSMTTHSQRQQACVKRVTSGGFGNHKFISVWLFKSLKQTLGFISCNASLP